MFLKMKILLAYTLLLVPLFLCNDADGRPDEDISDPSIIYWVKYALENDPRTAETTIKVNAKDGVVTLADTVDNLAARNFAEMEAMKVKGVRGVVNDIVVRKVYDNDAYIEEALRNRIRHNPVFAKSSLLVTVLDGKVTISGPVSSAMELRELSLLASELRGVREVINNCTIEADAARSDSEIQSDVIEALKRDVYLTTQPIQVAVKSATVTLSDTVGTAYLKRRAALDVLKVKDVKKVNNLLVIDPHKWSGTRRGRLALSDHQLQHNIRAELDADFRLDDTDIRIEVERGYVTLSGRVPHRAQLKYAGQDVETVHGVKWLTNNLSVGDLPRPDWEIKEDVTFDLKSDYALFDQPIHVDVMDGVVKLTGSANNLYEKSRAEDWAFRVEGVKSVENEIVVPRNPSFSDAELQSEIHERLRLDWVTSSIAGRIHVDVEEGVAFLRGSVHDWSERQEAEQIAEHTAGIWTVVNGLKIKG